MLVPFEKLPDSSRIWIYQSDRKLLPDEQQAMAGYLAEFTTQWTAHNQELQASFAILYDWFLVLGVDGSVNEASGCSIDASVRAVQELGLRFGVDLFNRTKIAFWIDEQIAVFALQELTQRLEENRWNSETMVFNNTIRSKGDLTGNWMIPARKSWLQRYLKKPVA